MRYARQAATTGGQDEDCPRYFCRKCFWLEKNNSFELLRA